MTPSELRFSQLGPLQDLLIKACPPHKWLGKETYVPDPEGVKSIKVLAVTLGMSAWGVQRWVHEGKVPAKRVAQIVENSNGAVTREDFMPYLF